MFTTMREMEDFEWLDISWFRIGYLDGRKLNPFNPPPFMKVAAQSYLRGYMVDFMRLFAPALKQSNVDKVIAGGRLGVNQSSLPAI